MSKEDLKQALEGATQIASAANEMAERTKDTQAWWLSAATEELKATLEELVKRA